MRSNLTFAAMACIVVLTVSSCQTLDSVSDADKRRWQQHVEQTEIIRDDFGVPHIYGKTDADAVFGLLYAQCEDDFKRVEQNYIWAIGRLAEVEGEEALYSDLRARLFMTTEQARQELAQSPEWLKELCQAFSDGINYYLHTHPEVKPRLLTRFEPWMPMYFSEGSIGGDIERVSIEKLKAFYEGGLTVQTTQDFKRSVVADLQEPQGSNGIAISGKLTENGNTLLLINPHTSFYFRGEVHMVSEEGLNAYGAVTWGQFFIYQGFNERTGWMHTSTYTDVIDEFVETTQETDTGLYYAYGDEWRMIQQSEVSLKYRVGDELLEKQFPMYHTHHGPITHAIDGKWTATAMMWEPAKALEQSYIRTKQSGYDGFRKMMDIRTNSSNNTVYADAEGNIAYFHGNFIPKRDVSFHYRKPVDGSNPATDWQGLHSVDENILVLNPENGWLQNCNSTPYTAAAEFSPKRADYPNYMSLDRENFRGIHAIDLLEKADKHSLESLIDLAHDPYLPAFEALVPGLIEAADQMSIDAALAEPIDVLRNWDFRTSASSVAMTLAHYYGEMFIMNGVRPADLTFMQMIEYWGSASPEQERVNIFSSAIQKLQNDFGTWNKPWGEVNRFQRLSGAINSEFDDDQPSIPISFASGRWGALAAYGATAQKNTKKIYGTRGNSFVAAVEFGDKVRAKSLLAGGQSGDPNSPHFDDQAQRYADAKFKPVAFYREDVEARAVSRYRPGEEVAEK